MIKFSIVTPTWFNKEDADNERQPRYEMFLRCINSVFTQTYQDEYEWIIVDDICTPSVEEVIKELEWKVPYNLKIKVLRQPDKGGRLIGRNMGMKEASGEWICWLDADDEYASTYLELVDQASQVYPDYQVFNFNHLIFNYDFSVYERKFVNMEEQGDKPFRAGVIGAGAFVFKKEVFEDIGLFPELGLWDFANWFFEKYPEVKPMYLNPNNGQYDSLGNPHGEDYAYFYMITRKYKTKKLNATPYFVHSHWGHKLAQEEPGKDPRWNPNLK